MLLWNTAKAVGSQVKVCPTRLQMPFFQFVVQVVSYSYSQMQLNYYLLYLFCTMFKYDLASSHLLPLGYQI